MMIPRVTTRYAIAKTFAVEPRPSDPLQFHDLGGNLDGEIGAEHLLGRYESIVDAIKAVAEENLSDPESSDWAVLLAITTVDDHGDGEDAILFRRVQTIRVLDARRECERLRPRDRTLELAELFQPVCL